MTAIPQTIMEEAQQIYADVDFVETAPEAIQIVAAALLAAEQRGAEMEKARCAAWHLGESMRLRDENSSIIADGGWSDGERLRYAGYHAASAAAIRNTKD